MRQSLSSLDTAHVTVTAAAPSQPGPESDATVTITALDGQATVGTASGAVGEALVSLKRLLNQSPWWHFTSECKRF